MRFHELLTEAVYHNLANALKRALPDKSAEIDAELAWAEQSLKRPDRINWYMLVIKNYFNNTFDRVVGDYNFTSLDQLHHDLIHFYGFNVPAIDAYAYKSQTISDIIIALHQILVKHQEAERNKPQPVTPQTGDRVLFDFGGGVQWWFVDRGYCSDEGRSGKHCGNVVGQRKTDQRLLSLRKDGHVLLTFVLEPDGALGEMKARGNQKPAEKYHPQIIRLLMWDQVTAIQGMGYLPDANFSMFDLSESNLAYIDAHKPKLIADQCRVTPIEILKAPKSIQKKYQQYVDNSAIHQLIADSSVTSWGNAVKDSPELILYAPHDMPDFENQLLDYLVDFKDRGILLKTPNSIARNTELLNKIIEVEPRLMAGVNPSVRGYQNLWLTAIKSDPGMISSVPEEFLDRNMCLTAVNLDARVLHSVPEEFLDRNMCLTAVSRNGMVLQYAPRELRLDRELCSVAVEQDGRALQYVPRELRDREMCLAAVKNTERALDYVPVNIEDREIYYIAVKKDPNLLSTVPEELRDRAMCLAAVERNGNVLPHVPEELQDQEMCLTAVKSKGAAIRFVNREWRNREMWLTAVKSNSDVLPQVPEKLEDRALFLVAVKSNGLALQYVPEESRDRLMCQTAVNQNGNALKYVPVELRDRELCLAAVKTHGEALARVPEKLKIDQEMCLAAVKSDGHALWFVPQELRMFREICLAAVKQDGHSLQHVPDNFKDRDMCMAAVEQTGRSLFLTPYDLRDRDLCLTAVRQDGNALNDVPEELRDWDMCMVAVSQNFDALSSVPKVLKTRIRRAIRVDLRSKSLYN